MYKYIIFIVVLLGRVQLNAQSGLLYVLNEGSSVEKGSLGVIDLSNFQYIHLDTLESYGNDLFVDDHRIYVVEGMGTIKIYQRNPFQILDTIEYMGARQIKKYGNQLIMTSNMMDSYFMVYDLTGDSILYSADTSDVRGISEGLWVENNKAYILVNNYGSDSQLVVWDLITKSRIKTLNTAQNPNDFIKIGNYLYFNCLDYINGVTFQRLDLSTDSINLTRPTNIVSYGGFTAKSNQEILFVNVTNYPNDIALWNVSSDVIDTFHVTGADAYAILYDTTSSTLFTSITDYTTFGKIRIKNSQVDTVINTHISPRRMFLYNNTTTEITKVNNHVPLIYPNPAHEQVKLVLPDNLKNLFIYNLQGRKVYETTQSIQVLDVKSWERGIYFVLISTGDQMYTHQLILE